MLNDKSQWQGVWTALITPFNDQLQIDWQAWEKIIAHQLDNGITGLVLFGSTGEGSTLSSEEKVELVKRTCAFVKDQPIKIIASTGTSCTRSTIELSKKVADAGAHGLLISTPAYNKPTQAGLLKHYQSIAEACPLPICLYHVPGRTAQKLTAEAIVEICRAVPQIKSVKEASADLELFAQVAKDSGTCVLSGDDPTYFQSLECGGQGLISVASNLFSAEMVEIYSEFKSASNESKAKAGQLQEDLQETYAMMACESNPGPIKAAMAIRGYCSNNLRLPLAPLTEINYKMVESFLMS